MIDAAAVIVVRRGPARGYQVLLVRRRRGASFMGSACVFPGGGVAAGDPPGDLRVTAARELFEEAGLLLAVPPIADATRAAWRDRQREGEPLVALLAGGGAGLDLGALRPWAHWITPSAEPRRFSARFFVAEAPPEQAASCDDDEITELVWVTPSEGVVRAGELRLPPPQLRTLWELMRLPTVDDVLAEAAARGPTPAPILPRLAPDPSGPCLLLPWDPAYDTVGTGDAAPLPEPPPGWAVGKSRFVLAAGAWSHVTAPAVTTPAVTAPAV